MSKLFGYAYGYYRYYFFSSGRLPPITGHRWMSLSESATRRFAAAAPMGRPRFFISAAPPLELPPVSRSKEDLQMVVLMKQQFTPDQLQEAIKAMKAGGVNVMVSKGSETTILGAEGDPSSIDQEMLEQLPGVERVMRVTEPYKKANRKYHPDDTVIPLPGAGP